MSWTTDPAAWARLGRRIKTARDRRGFTQIELSERAGVSLSAVSNAEAGRVPSGRWPRTLTAIERALGWGAGSMEAVLEGGEPLAPSQMELAVELDEPEPEAPAPEPALSPRFRTTKGLAEYGKEALKEVTPPARQLVHLCALLGASDGAVDAYDRALRDLLAEAYAAQGWSDQEEK